MTADPTEQLIAALAEGLHNDAHPDCGGLCAYPAVARASAAAQVAALAPEARDAMLLGFAVEADGIDVLELKLVHSWNAKVWAHEPGRTYPQNGNGPTPLAAVLTAQEGLDDA